MKKIFTFLTLLVSMNIQSQTLVPFLKKNGKYIFVDSATMKPAFNQEFDMLPPIFNKDIALILTSNGKILLNKKGEKLLIKYSEIKDFNKNIAVVKEKGYDGLVKTSGEIILDFKYDELSILPSSDILLFKKNEKYGFIDISGRIILESIDCNEIAINDFDPVIFFEKNAKTGIYDFHGNLISSPIFDFDLGDLIYTDGLLLFKENDLIGFKDIKNNTVIKPIYNYATTYSEGLCFVRNENSAGYIDKNGKLIITGSDFWMGGEFHNGIASVLDKDMMMFYINKKGEKLYTSSIDKVKDRLKEYNVAFKAISEGLIKIQYNKDDLVSGATFIDTKGDFLFPLRNDNEFEEEFSDVSTMDIGNYKNGFGQLSKSIPIINDNGEKIKISRIFYIDKKGRTFFEK